MWRQKSPKTDLHLKPPVETIRVTEQAPRLHKTSFSKYLLSIAFFILTLNRYHWSLKSSRNKPETCQIFFSFLQKGFTLASCVLIHRTAPLLPFLSRDPYGLKAQILLLPSPPPPQRKLIDLFSLLSLSAPMPYQNALASSPFPLSHSFIYWTCSIWMLQASIYWETLGHPFNPGSNFYTLLLS